MNRETLFQSMNGIDDEILERSEGVKAGRRKKYLAAAACLCLLAAALWRLLPEKALESNPPVSTDAVETGATAGAPQWVFRYNDAGELAKTDAARQYVPGYFTETLSRSALEAVEPDAERDWMEVSGYAGFDGAGNLLEVFLEVTTTLPEAPVRVTIREDTLREAILPEDGEISPWGRGTCRVYRGDLGEDRVLLAAEGEINGCRFLFEMEPPAGEEERAKADFEQVLVCFAAYPEDSGRPGLRAVTPEAIPEYLNESLTPAEARADPDFGPYFLPSAPAGFGEESVTRYRDQNNDSLSGLWTRDYDELRWTVSRFREEDAGRLTGVGEPENYDLSLYPIPRAESVPENLREIVDMPIFNAEELTLEAVWARAYKTGETGDSDGWRMGFSVRYGGIVVEVRGKGVEPQWIFEQLMSLPGAS